MLASQLEYAEGMLASQLESAAMALLGVLQAVEPGVDGSKSITIRSFSRKLDQVWMAFIIHRFSLVELEVELKHIFRSRYCRSKS